MRLIPFLLARIDEDEKLAAEADGSDEGWEGGDADWCPNWLLSGVRHLVRNCDIECPKHEDDPEARCGTPARYAGTHMANWDPRRVRAECTAKREIIGNPAAPAGVLRALASVWWDHPDYNSTFENVL